MLKIMKAMGFLALAAGMGMGVGVETGCASRRKANLSPDEATPTTLLTVDNQNFYDMTIYAFAGSRRIRLGMVTGLSKAQIVLPPLLTQGSGEVRFQADPIGGPPTPLTERITVDPGDEIVFQIPPVLTGGRITAYR
jgi:hypothetical protein